MISIDGSTLEGGGQVVRMAMCLSALTTNPIKIVNIRAGRNKPGLMAQHLVGLQLIRDMTNGELTGDQLSSTSVTFKPNRIGCGHFFGDTKTAGSITLLFQICLPCLLFSPETSFLRLKGGTNAEMAPQIDFTINVLKPILEKFGINFETDLIRRGYYPKGGGEVVFKVDPIEAIKPIEMTDFGHLTRITGYSFVAGVLPIKLAHSMADSATNRIREAFPRIPIDIKRVQENRDKAFGNGSGIVLVAESSNGCRMSGSALGRHTVSADSVGQKAAIDLIEDISSGGAVDRYIQDQLIVFMALASGKSTIRTGPLTLHTKTAIHFAEMLTKSKFEIKVIEKDKQFLVECHGIGLKNQFI